MEENSIINLRRFIPKKASKWQLLKILIYFLVLGFLFFLLSYEFTKKKVKKPIYNEIHNIKIDPSLNKMTL